MLRMLGLIRSSLYNKVFSGVKEYSFEILYMIYRLLCCLLFAAVLLPIIIQLNKRYGKMFAFSFAVVSLLSNWIINFSRNLYWVEFTWFIPLLLSLLWLNYKDRRMFIYPLYFVSIFVKCLCGYEYLSTIMLSGILFIFVELFLVGKKEKKDYLIGLVIIGLLCLLGFICALGIHAYMYGDGDLIDGLEGVKSNLVMRRTYGNSSNFANKYADSLNASVFAVLFRYFVFNIRSPLDGPIIFVFFILTIIVLCYQRKALKKNNNFEICLFVISLLAPLSWLVLAKAHSYIHMNFVIFYMGWVQSCLYIIMRFVTIKLKIKFPHLEMKK